MWEPRPLTTLWAFMACYRDNFTFFLLYRCLFNSVRWLHIHKPMHGWGIINPWPKSFSPKGDTQDLYLESARDPSKASAILIEVFRGFLQTLQTNATLAFVSVLSSSLHTNTVSLEENAVERILIFVIFLSTAGAVAIYIGRQVSAYVCHFQVRSLVTIIISFTWRKYSCKSSASTSVLYTIYTTRPLYHILKWVGFFTYWLTLQLFC
jgi:hypothetical protein